jgi:hypothetical protein
MIKAEIYYKPNKAIKISSKFTIPKIMEILEILMNLDYLEFSKSFQEEIQNSIKTGKIFNKNISDPEESTTAGKDFYKIAELELRQFHKLFPITSKAT